jgi:hypothetical protein
VGKVIVIDADIIVMNGHGNVHAIKGIGAHTQVDIDICLNDLGVRDKEDTVCV